MYRPRLTGGKLVKAREPAWRMFEQTRDPDCLQERFRALAPVYRLEYQHHGDSRKSGRGYPDVHMWGTGLGSMYVELKRMRRGYPDGRDDPSPDQVRLMSSLLAAPHPVYLARPCCMLVGVVDELMAEFAGVRCRYAGGRPDRRPAPVAAAIPESDPVVYPTRPVVAALPGAEVGEPFPSAVGYIVAMPGDDATADAVRELEGWLRDAGFPSVHVPYPMRLVVGEAALIVQVRAAPGERVWRAGVPARPFPDHLIKRARAVCVAGPSSAKVAWLIEQAPPSGVLPAG